MKRFYLMAVVVLLTVLSGCGKVDEQSASTINDSVTNTYWTYVDDSGDEDHVYIHFGEDNKTQFINIYYKSGKVALIDQDDEYSWSLTTNSENADIIMTKKINDKYTSDITFKGYWDDSLTVNTMEHIGISGSVDKMSQITEEEYQIAISATVEYVDDNTTEDKVVFTNKYGTPTTKCAHSGCENYIASSGDTNCCVLHSNKCANCSKYIDEDALYCMDCLGSSIKK